MLYENERVNILYEELVSKRPDNESGTLHHIMTYLDMSLTEDHNVHLSWEEDSDVLVCSYRIQLQEIYDHKFDLDLHIRINEDCAWSKYVTIYGARPRKTTFYDVLNYPEPHNDVLFAERILGEVCITYPLRKGFNTKSARKIII